MKYKMTDIESIKLDDYDKLYELWMSCSGMGLNSVDDSREGIARFLKRNPDTCFKVIKDNMIVGAILIGTDGRRAYIYHTAVHPDYRRKNIAKDMVQYACDVLRNMKISKVALVTFASNVVANVFWEKLGFTTRDDIIYRNLSLVDMERYDT